MEERREGRGGRVSETVSGSGTACGRRPRGQGLVGKQEVAARPCACEHAAASGRGEEDDGGLQWWAGPASAGPPGGWASGKRRVSFLCSVFYLLFSIFFCSFVALLKNTKSIPKIMQLLMTTVRNISYSKHFSLGLFEHLKYFIVFKCPKANK